MTRRVFLARTALAAGGTTWLLKGDWGARAEGAGGTGAVGGLGALADSHDLRLPRWGCYTKTYNGISHVADLERGLRFDLSVFPGHYRREVLVPNVNWESGFHPWEAAPDLSCFSYRYELEWKDRVYCDVSFSTLSERSRLVRAEFVNNHLMSTILDRGIARREIDPDRLTPRVFALPTDLVRHDLLMTLKPPSDDVIQEIVDDIFLPLVSRDRLPRRSSG